MKMPVFWNVVPCSLVEVYGRFRVLPASMNIVLMMKEASASKTAVNVYQTTRHIFLEDMFILVAMRT
jgi:hypothetical protein